ncbi:hypothetical protein HDU78_001645 [Chytriomyces hyalinus]|nr:hypothetical protein HDU78_001645 [Chytriomyces hyalinus]
MAVSFEYLTAAPNFQTLFVCANYTQDSVAQASIGSIDYSALTPLIDFDASVNPITQSLCHTLCLLNSAGSPESALDRILNMTVYSTTVKTMTASLQEIYDNPTLFTTKISFFKHFQFFGFQLQIPESLLHQSSECFTRLTGTYGPYFGIYSNLGATLLCGILLLAFLGFVVHYEIIKRGDRSPTVLTVLNISLFMGIVGVLTLTASLTTVKYKVFHSLYDQRAIRFCEFWSSVGLCFWQISFACFAFKRSEAEIRCQFPRLFNFVRICVQILFPFLLIGNLTISIAKVIFPTNASLVLINRTLKLVCGGIGTVFDALFAFCFSRALYRLNQEIGANPQLRTISVHGLYASGSLLLSYVFIIAPGRSIDGSDEATILVALSMFCLVNTFVVLFALKVRLHFMREREGPGSSTERNSSHAGKVCELTPSA